MSLQTIVSRGLVGRLHLRQGPAAMAPQPRDTAMSLPGGSMRILEGAIAFTALATALLIGVGR